MKNFVIGLIIGVTVASFCSLGTAAVLLGGIVLGALIVKVLS